MPARDTTTKKDKRGGWNKGLVGFNRTDCTDFRTGKLTVLKPTGTRTLHGQAIWECICDCGTTCYLSSNQIKGNKSCGCLKRNQHRLSKTNAYSSWLSARLRCLDPTHHNYHNYGARGITMCERWLDFKNFYLDMGNREAGLSIERINNNGNYSCGKCEECLRNNWPVNCRWANSLEQGQNRRTNKYLTAFGRTASLAEWSRITGIPKSTIKNRARKGKMTNEEIVTPLPHHGARPSLINSRA